MKDEPGTPANDAPAVHGRWRGARRIGSLFASNASGTVLGQLVQLATIPVQLRYLGAEQFGLLVLFNSFVMAGSLADGGIGPTALRFVAKFAHRARAVEHVVASALTMLVLMFAAVSILALTGAALYQSLVEPAPARLVLAPVPYVGLVLVALGATMLSTFALSILKGFKHYRAFALIESLQRIALPLVATVMAVQTQNVKWVLIANCLCLGVAALLSLVSASKQCGVRIRLTGHLTYLRKRMLAFSSWVWMQSIFAYLGTQADRLIIASLMSLSQLASYAVAMSVANAALAVVVAGAGFLIPEAASRANDKTWLATNFARFTFMLSAVTAGCITLGLPVLQPFLVLWLGEEHALPVLPILLPLLWTISNAATSIPGNHILTAMGRSRFVAIAGATANTFVLAAMIIGGMSFGLAGVLGGKLLSVLAGFVIRRTIAHRIFDIPKPTLAAVRMVWPTLAGGLVVLPLSWYFLVP